MGKIWTFYKKPDEKLLEIGDEIPLDTKYALYAITSSKKIASIFEKSRNMDLFLKKVIECDKDDLEDYMKRHRSSHLNWYWLQSYRNKNTSMQEPYFTRVLMTENELNFTLEVSDGGALAYFFKHFIPTEIFESHIRKYLRILKYDEFSAFVMMERNQTPYNMDEDIDFYSLTMSFEQFGTFFMLYEKTFSERFAEYIEVSDDVPDTEYNRY